jgi:hypothetical protein
LSPERSQNPSGKKPLGGQDRRYGPKALSHPFIIHWGKQSAEDIVLFAHKLDKAITGWFQMTADGFAPHRKHVPEMLLPSAPGRPTLFLPCGKRDRSGSDLARSARFWEIGAP